MPEITLSEFLGAFYPDDNEKIHFRAFKPKGVTDNSDNRPLKLIVTRKQLATDKALQQKLIQLNKTLGIYFAVNSGGDNDKQITRFNAFFAEMDDRPIEEQHLTLNQAPLPTSIRVETKKSVHAYWLFSGDCDANTWRNMQHCLIAYFSSDEKIKNPSRVMRLPFFNHIHCNEDGIYSYKKCEVIEFEPSRKYTVDEMRTAFSVRELQPLGMGTNSTDHSSTGIFSSWDELNAELCRRMLAHSTCQIKGEWARLKGICHNGNSNTALSLNLVTKAYSCFNDCDTIAILRAFDLPGKPNGNHLKSESNRQPEMWETPAVFNEHNLPEFPIDSLPKWLKIFVRSLAISTQTPVDLAAMLSLTICAAAVAGNVRIKIRSEWEEPLNIFSVIVMPPGSRKSSVFAEITLPLLQLEAELADEKRPIISEAETKYRMLEERLRQTEKDAAKAEGSEREVKEQEAISLAQELVEMVVPTLPRLIADDCTPERLASLLCEQGGRMSVLSPEGDVFELIAGRYSNGAPNFAVFLKGHAGDSLRVDRRNRPSEFVKQPALTVGLTVQPDVIRGLVDKPGFRGRGLIGRFLYCWPVSMLGKRETKPASIEDEVRQTYLQNIKKLASLPPGKDADSNQVARLLHLTAEAENEIYIFSDWLEPQLAEDGALGSMTDWAGKLVGAVVRVAGILHLAEYVNYPAPWEIKVSAETIKQTVTIGHYLIQHARVAFSEMGADQEVEAAKYILRWIKKWVERTGELRFKKQDVWQGVKGRFQKVTDMEPALFLLIDHGYLRLEITEIQNRRGRKPGEVYAVNPFISSYNSYKSYNSASEVNSRDFRNSREVNVEAALENLSLDTSSTSLEEEYEEIL